MVTTDSEARRQRAAQVTGVAVAAALAAALVKWAGSGGAAPALLSALLAVALAICAATYARARAGAATRQQRAALEQALAERQATEAFLRLMADSLPARLSYWDRDNRCRFANRGFCEWHGVTPQQMLGRRIADLGAPWDRRARANTPRVEAVLAGRAQRFEREDTSPGGTPCVSIAHYVPDWRGDEVVGFIVLSTDLSAEKARERELAAALQRAESATRAKSAFLANMSHEIRTPLNVILGLVQVLRRDVVEPGSGQHLALVEDASRHLLALIDDILDLSRIEAGKLAIEPEDFDLRALFGRLQSLLGERAESKGLRLTVQAEGLPDRVRGDPRRLLQALLNLAGNAVKFTDRGHVTIAARTSSESPDGWWLHVEVSDTGPGITPEGQARLFEPFEQGDASATRRYGGSGLGLAITRQLVGLLGGTLELRSQPGEGTCAVVELPLQRPEAPPVSWSAVDTEQALRARHAGRRVLLVEDNELNQIVAGELVRRVGLTVSIASDGSQALAAARRAPPDLILMDVHMPVQDGLAATRAWRSHEADVGLHRVPVIALTATAFAEEREACLTAGMDDHVAKPVDAQQLYATLLRWLDTRADEAAQARSATQP